MKKILYAAVAVIGVYGYGYAMQKGVASQLHVDEASSPFAFVGKNPVLEDISSSPTPVPTDSIWNKMSCLSEEEIDSFLAPDDLSEAEVKVLELKIPRTENALEDAFFGNKTLSGEFAAIKRILTQVNKFSPSQVSRLNWLVQNLRGDCECAKMLATFYRFRKEMVMYSFWRHVALSFHLAVGDL